MFLFDRNALEEVKVYLKKNSLTARSLTIVDVVHPTTMPIKDPERIQIIDRYVMAKVWDDVTSLFFRKNKDKMYFVFIFNIRSLPFFTNLMRRSFDRSIIIPLVWKNTKPN